MGRGDPAPEFGRFHQENLWYLQGPLLNHIGLNRQRQSSCPGGKRHIKSPLSEVSMGQKISNKEQESISRSLLSWLNTWPDKPVGVINFTYVPDDAEGMSLSTPQGTFMVRKYVRGAYQARYTFKIIYRVIPGNSNNKRLTADETLESFADWIINNGTMPQLEDGKKVVKFSRSESDPDSVLFNRYEDGTEDHQIIMTMDYTSE